jgi:hypothetical protein
MLTAKVTGTKYTNAIKAKAFGYAKGIYSAQRVGTSDLHLQLARAALVATDFLDYLSHASN